MVHPLHSHRKSGFTLLELLVVLLIIGLLAAYVGPKYFGQIGKSQAQMVKAQIDAFEKALDQYRIDTGHFPTTQQGLQALFTQPSGEANWKGPYLRKGVPNDPWGKAYVYKAPSAVPNLDYDIVSHGKDGQSGGAGEDADISNAQ